MRFIPTAVHGVMDYVMGAVLIAAPWLLKWNQGPESWVPMILGMGVILYSLMTNYECGVVGLIPMPIHLGLDALGGIILAMSPWLFGFADRIWVPHLVLGLAEVGAALMTQLIPTRGPSMTSHRSTGA